jgi:hypothetical protein
MEGVCGAMACVVHSFAMLHGVVVKLLFWRLPWQHVVWRQQAVSICVYGLLFGGCPTCHP